MKSNDLPRIAEKKYIKYNPTSSVVRIWNMVHRLKRLTEDNFMRKEDPEKNF